MGIVGYFCDPSTQKTEAGGLKAPDHPRYLTKPCFGQLALKKKNDLSCLSHYLGLFVIYMNTNPNDYSNLKIHRFKDCS